MASIDPLIVDVWEEDIGGKPDWAKLVAAGAPWHGAIVKASEGLHYAPAWFGVQWKAIKAAAGARYGEDFFRGCYHYLRITEDPVQQADLYLGMVDKAGGWDHGDLWPIVDVEGKNNPQKPSTQQIVDCVSAWTAQVTAKTGRKPMLYGNIYLAEHGVTQTMGCQTLWLARYTPDLPPVIYTRIGWSLPAAPAGTPTVWGWQYCGDGKGFLRGYPTQSPIGAVDVTAVIVNGGGTAAVEWTRAHLSA